MKWLAIMAFAPALCGQNVAAAVLKPPTVVAFEKYIGQTETRLEARKSFLWADESPERARRVKQGEIVVEGAGARALIDVNDGLIHDWVGTVFVPGVTLQQTLAHVRDYDNDARRHHEVVASHIVRHEGNEYRVYMRLLKKKIITVVLDTEHDIRYIPVDAERWKSHSRTTKIAEVQNAGKKDERELPPGTGYGFLWKLYTYWRFQERDGGTWIECEAISLTRDVPTGLGWLIEPIIRSLPKESLENTLRETAAGLKK
jgi:hypothetical protein